MFLFNPIFLPYVALLCSVLFLLTPFGLSLFRNKGLTMPFFKARLVQTAKVLPLSLSCVYIGFAYAPHDYFIVSLGLVLLMSVFVIGIACQQSKHSLLVVESLLFNNSVKVHLTKPDSVLTKAAYAELFALIPLLKQKGITSIILDSPIFYKETGEMRAFNRTKKSLLKQGVHVGHSKSHWAYHLPGTLILLFYKHLLSCESLKNTDATKWHRHQLFISSATTQYLQTKRN